MKKKLILGLLASSLTLACVAGCTGNGGGTSTDSGKGLDDAKAYLSLLYNKPDLVEGRADYDVVNTVTIDGVTYNVTWSVNVEAGVVIEAGADKTVVNVDETAETAISYVLTATITDAKGNSTTANFNRTLLAAPSIVPQAISAAPVEGTAYKLYMYQAQKGNDLYFIGEMSGYYLGTTNVSNGDTYEDGVDVYVEKVADKDAYYLTFTYEDTKSYIGVANNWSNGAYHDNAIIADDTTVNEGEVKTFEFTWSDEYKTLIATLDGIKSGNDEATTETKKDSFFLGTNGSYYTFGAMSVSKAADSYVGCLVTMIDKSSVSAENKVAAEKTALNIQTIYNGDATVELPVKGATYGDVAIAWSINPEITELALVDNVLTITAPSSSKTVVITATLTCGDVSVDVDVELTLNPTPSAAVIPEAGVAYKMYLNQVTNNKVLYIDGGVSGRYLTMTETASEGVDVYAEVVDGGYKFYTNVDGAKKYINIYNNSDDKTSVNYADSTENVYSYDAEKNCWYTAFADDTYYLGTYNNFDTVSASKTSYITSENTGVLQFPLLFIKATDIPLDNVPGGDTPVVDDLLVENTAYKFYIEQNKVGATYYITGALDGKFLVTTTDPTVSTDVYAEKATDGYYFYINVDSVKKYINIGAPTSGSTGVITLDDTATSVYTYDADKKAWVTTTADVEYALGTYGTYTTISASKSSYITSSNTGIEQFPATFILANEAKAPTAAEKIAFELGKIAVSSDVTGAKDITLDIAPEIYSDVTISWSIKTDESSIATLTDNKLSIANPTANTTVTVTATVSCGDVTETKDYTIAVAHKETTTGEETLATFTFGANGNAEHKDGSDLGTSKTYSDNGYDLVLTNMSKVFAPAYDATGKSCIKIGTSKAVGSFTFTVDEDVDKVIINIAGYKAATSTDLTINGQSYNVKTESDNGEYTVIEIDTSTTKTITLTTVTYRAMIDSIVFIGIN